MKEPLTEKEMETKSGFPCVCGATDYDDAADKCDGNGDSGVCCAKYMLENYLLPDSEH